MRHFCQILPLDPAPALITEYVQRHSQVWPKEFQWLPAAGVFDMQAADLAADASRKWQRMELIFPLKEQIA